MEESQYDALARVEDRHWWHLALRQTIHEALADHRPARDLRILDVGCGTGGLLASFEARHRAFGMDLSATALRYCRRRSLRRLSRGTMDHLPFANDTFDVVLSVDSLIHTWVESHGRALGEHRRVLRPRGLLVLQVSAFEWLRGRHDRAVLQGHRYTRRELERLLVETGLVPIASRYRLAFLPPLMVINNLVSRVRPPRRTEIELPRPRVNRLLHRAALADLRWGRRTPLGSSLFCLAEKPVDA